MADTRQVYVVVRQAWQRFHERFTGDDTPVIAFANRKQAQEYLDRLEPLEAKKPDRDDPTEVRFTIAEMTVQD